MSVKPGENIKNMWRNSLHRHGSKGFFDAHVFTMDKFVRLVRANSNEVLEKSPVTQELVDVLPLFLELIVASGERWILGKIKETDHPYDIFMCPAKNAVMHSGRICMDAVCFVQTKRITVYPRRAVSGAEWQSLLQREVDRFAQNQRPGDRGVLHFCNMIPFNEDMKIEELYEVFETLRIREMRNIDAVTISYEIFDKWKNENVVCTWMISPHVGMMGLLPETLEKANKLYRTSPRENLQYEMYSH